MAGYSSGNAPTADRKLGDMTNEEFHERGMMDMFAQVQGALQEHPELTAGALAQIQGLGAKKTEQMSNVPDDELKQAGLMDGSGNMLASIRRMMQENPKLSVAAALAAAGLAVAGGVYAYKKFAADETPIADVSNEEMGERGLLDSSGNMLATVKAKMDENPKMTVAAALAATGCLVVGGIALSRKFSSNDTPVADLPKDELTQRGLLDATGNMLEPVKDAVAEHPKLTVAAALAATGLVVAGGVALHHSSSADTPVADMTNEQLQEMGLEDESGGGLLSSIKHKIKANPKMSVAAALAVAAALGVGAYAVHHAMNKPGKGKKGKKDKGGKDKKEKEKKGGKDKEKKEKGGKEKKEKGGKKGDKKKGKTKDLPGVGTRGLFFDPADPDADLSSSSDSDSEPEKA
jgi:hypothetical protein